MLSVHGFRGAVDLHKCIGAAVRDGLRNVALQCARRVPRR